MTARQEEKQESTAMSENVAVVCDVTGVTAEQAASLLEMSNGNVDAAIGLFFETGQLAGVGKQNQPVDEPVRRAEPERKTIDIEPENPEEKFGESSIDDIMKKAVDHGAKSIGEVGAQKKEDFVGTGHKVGEAGKSSQKVVMESKQDKRRVIVFYKDCFTLDDGPPRKFDDPANKEFLTAIRDGVYPEEIRPRHGQEIEVELIDKKGEDYKPPPKDIKAFDGPVLSMGGGKATNAMLAVSKALVLDTSKPSGGIKVRFLDGSNVVVKANHDHTIGDLRNHLESLKPCKKPFLISILGSGQPLTDLGATLKSSGVIGAAIVQSI